MVGRDTLEQQLDKTLTKTDFPWIGEKYEGKVRDSYMRGKERVLITSDRLSAFDVVLTSIPFKGQILNRMATHWFKKTADIVENHIIDVPHPNAFITKEVDILPVEVVIRGYLTGSAWRDYQAGKDVSGISLPTELRKSQQFESPLITPSTKAEKGDHDEPISSDDVVRSGLVEKKRWEEVCEVAMNLFRFGQEEASKQGLILVDTKYEFGISKDGNNQLILADEVHTQDSSRYWIADTYSERFAAGEEPQMLDKEFVRGWLINQGYMGDGTPPEFPAAVRIDTAEKYIQACEKVTGVPFEAEVGDQGPAIEAALKKALK